MDKGIWGTIVHGVTKSLTQLEPLSRHISKLVGTILMPTNVGEPLVQGIFKPLLYMTGNSYFMFDHPGKQAAACGPAKELSAAYQL